MNGIEFTIRIIEAGAWPFAVAFIFYHFIQLGKENKK